MRVQEEPLHYSYRHAADRGATDSLLRIGLNTTALPAIWTGGSAATIIDGWRSLPTVMEDDRDEITPFIGRCVQGGDAEAAARLWKHFHHVLLQHARAKLGSRPDRAGDEEDVVLSAFDCFFRGAAAGRFDRLKGRDELRNLLVKITTEKALDRRRRAHRQKRGGGAVRGESAFLSLGPNVGHCGIGHVPGSEPTPEDTAVLVEEYRRLLACLGDPELRQIAVMRLEEYRVLEIAQELGCSVRTVKRRLALIRKKWECEAGGEP